MDLAVAPQQSPVEVFKAKRWDAVIDFMGGIAGGTASVYVGQPLDTVKVKMQTFPTTYTNAWTCFTQTYRVEGVVRGLYAGTIPSLAAQIAENSLLFMFYGVCQKCVMMSRGKTDTLQLNVLENSVAGGTAAFFSSLGLCPTELVKCRLQAMKEMVNAGQISPQEYKRAGPASLTREILREEGVRGLFRGLVATLAREMPGYFFFFGAYEMTRSYFAPPGKTKDDINSLQTMVSGAMGGIACWTSIFPADVVKSRVQIQSGSTQAGFVKTLVTIAKTEGVLALYKGLGPCLVRTAPATGALFLAYENVKRLLSNLAYDS